MRRKLAFPVILMMLAALAATAACSRPGPVDQQLEGPVAFDLNEPKIKERLGEDDGFSFVIMYGADIKGSLETCG